MAISACHNFDIGKHPYTLTMSSLTSEYPLDEEKAGLGFTGVYLGTLPVLPDTSLYVDLQRI
jgi:hypothetical protein